MKKQGSIPIDGNPSSRRSETDAAISLTLEPFQSTLVVLEEWGDFFITTLVVILTEEERGWGQRQQRFQISVISGMTTDLQPLFFFFSKHAFLDHPRLNRHTSESVETQPNIAIEFASCLQGGE
jgi:hypothetical protein